MTNISQISTKYHVDPRLMLPEKPLKNEHSPPDRMTAEGSKSKNRGKNRSRFTTRSLMRLHVDETFSNSACVQRIAYNVASKWKHSIHDRTSRYSPVFCSTFISLCRRSHSMNDLPTVHCNLKGSCSFRFDMKSSFARSDQRFLQTFTRSHPAIKPRDHQCDNRVMENDTGELQDMIRKAASFVCHALVLNAWRRRRRERVELLETIQQLTERINHLQLQTVVLRRLLYSGNNRVTALGGEIQRVTLHMESVTQEKMGLAAERNILERQNERLKAAIEERVVETQNCKNELLSTKNQLKAVESQIIRDQRKLTQLREDNEFLRQKVSANEIMLAEYNQRVDHAEVVAEYMRGKMAIQVGIIDELQDDKNELSRELRNIQAEKIRLNECILVTTHTDRASNMRAANLAIQLREREAALRRIESAYNTQLLELNNLKGWGQQNWWYQTVLQITGSMVRVPRGILRTFSFLLPRSIIS